jgi:RNA polymerase sigma factor (sigma-70 family)
VSPRPRTPVAARQERERTVMQNEIVNHPEVVKTLRATLDRHGVFQADMPDAVANAQVGLLEAITKGNAPAADDLSGWKSLACTVAKRQCASAIRKEETRRKHDEGLCEDPDEHTPLEHFNRPDPIDAGRQIRVLVAQFEAGVMPDKGLDILEAVAANMSYEEIAEDLGISESTVRGRLHRMRKLFKERLLLLGITIALLMLLAIGSGVELVASRTPPAPSTRPPVQLAHTCAPAVPRRPAPSQIDGGLLDEQAPEPAEINAKPR